MLIAITGHTKGIGLAVAQWFMDRNHTVIGFSRSNGFNVKYDAQRIANIAVDADVFINNANLHVGQVELLYAFYDLWKDDPTKTILSIGSNASDGNKSYRAPYAVYKAALDKTVEQLQNTEAACRIMNLRPGYVDTQRTTHINHPMMSTEYIAGVVGWMFEQPFLVKSLTIVPTSRNGAPPNP